MEVRTVYSSGGRKRFPVRSVTKIETASDGSVTRTVLGGAKRKRRVSKKWRKFDKALFRMSKAQETAASEYRRRHERSNRRKKNGAVRDLGKNVMRAQRKGIKRMKISVW